MKKYIIALLIVAIVITFLQVNHADESYVVQCWNAKRKMYQWVDYSTCSDAGCPFLDQKPRDIDMTRSCCNQLDGTNLSVNTGGASCNCYDLNYKEFGQCSSTVQSSVTSDEVPVQQCAWQQFVDGSWYLKCS